MKSDVFHALLSPAGQVALQAAEDMFPVEADFLRCQASLSRSYPPETARAALEIAILRRDAEDKFPNARQMYFTRQALEQASSYTISTYRAQRYLSTKHLADLGCSIGGDMLALAAVAPVVGIDLDPLRLMMARTNLDAIGQADRAGFILSDLLNGLPLHSDPSTGLFFDPARRTGSRRAFSVHDYQPPLSIIQTWLTRFPTLGVKISPGVNLDELGPYDAEVEFISLSGELKEAVLWFGPLKTTYRRATLLPGLHTLERQNSTLERLPLSEPRAYLYEPDPAILRAGLVGDLGQQLDAAQLDSDIAYLTANQRLVTPFARVWQVEAWLPFQLKRLREALRQRNVGHIVVKKRGSPLQPEDLIHRLRLEGDQQRVIFLTHLRGRPIVIIAMPE
jgi:hypothetical protein